MTDKELYELAEFIPEYWKEHLEEKIAKIHENQIKSGADSASFGLISDIHWVMNMKHSAALMEKVMTECAVPYYFESGDMVSGKYFCPADDIIGDIQNTQKLFHKLLHKRLVVEGNHDACFSTKEEPHSYAECISASAVYNYIYRYLSNYSHITFDKRGTSYFADDTPHKVRYIALNTHNVPSDEVNEEGFPLYHRANCLFTQDEIDWLANVALDVPTTDWSVVVCTHETFCNNHPNPCGHGIVLDILDAFRRHTSVDAFDPSNGIGWKNELRISADFTGKGGNVIAWVGGHLHCDFIEKHKGINIVSIVNDCMQDCKPSPYVHEWAKPSEQAFDIFTVDRHAHKVYITRVGCGEDREFEYEVF